MKKLYCGLYVLIFLLVSACSSVEFMIDDLGPTNKANLARMEQEFNALKSRAHSLDQEITLANGDLFGLTRRLDKLNLPKGELDAINFEISDLQSKTQTLDSNLENYQSEIAKIEAQVAANNIEVSAYETRRHELEQNISKLETLNIGIKKNIRETIEKSLQKSSGN